MSEGSRAEQSEPAGYVEFFAAGQPAVGEYLCSECGYGVAVRSVLPQCPMCQGAVWEATAWRPFMRNRTRLQ